MKYECIKSFQICYHLSGKLPVAPSYDTRYVLPMLLTLLNNVD